MTRKRTSKVAPKEQALNYEPAETPSTPEERAPIEQTPEAKDEEMRAAVQRANRFKMPHPTEGGVPASFKLPDGFVFPRGRTAIFIKFKADWTDTPWKGVPMIDARTGKNYTEEIPGVDEKGDATTETRDVLWRQCICWPMNIGDKKLAIGRSQGDANRLVDELTKQMLRAVDGEACDWGIEGPQEIFWNEIGERCRGLLNRMFNKLHILQQEEMHDFLSNCIETRTRGT